MARIKAIELKVLDVFEFQYTSGEFIYLGKGNYYDIEYENVYEDLEFLYPDGTTRYVNVIGSKK